MLSRYSDFVFVPFVAFLMKFVAVSLAKSPEPVSSCPGTKSRRRTNMLSESRQRP